MIPPEEGWEILEWDSGVFGMPVARVKVARDAQALKAAIDGARRTGVRLIYLLTESSDIARVAGGMGATLVSERVTFSRSVISLEKTRLANAVPVETWSDRTATPELIQLARDAGRYSRFYLDPRIPRDIFERIYDAWITNSLNGRIAEEVMVTRDSSSVTGLVTVGTKSGRADIGLLAVRAEARGRGLGRRLVEASLDWAAKRQLAESQVVTQRANVEACRLYESCGYTIERAEHVFHFWS